MTNLATLRRARKSFEQRAWAESYRLLRAADCDAPLDAEDLERLAIAAHLVARDDECESVTARAHQAFLDRGDREGAARAAFWLGFSLMQRGAIAPASGWFARAGRLLDEGQLDCAVRGYLLIPVAITCIVQGDPATADATFSQAAEFARRFVDRDLAAVACHGRGRALIRLGRIAEGVALFDEAMASVIAGEVTSLVAGDVYCSVLEAARRRSICGARMNGRPRLRNGARPSPISCAIEANVCSIAPKSCSCGASGMRPRATHRARVSS